MIDIFEAEYEESKNPYYKGNPLIECLPELRSFETFYKTLLKRSKPIARAEALKLDIPQRDELLTLLKQYFFVPSERMYELYRTIHNSLTSGYHQRNPSLRGNHDKLKRSYRDLHTQIDLVNESTSSLSSCLMGISGIGKTTTVNKILSLYPLGIKHTRKDLDPFVQIPFIKVECPKDSSIKDLCINFFQVLDSLLNTNYQSMYGKPRETANNMVNAMAKLTVSHQVGMLIVDEIQHLTNGKSANSNLLHSSAEMMLNFFVNLNNKLKIPILIVGTPESIRLFSSNHRLPRRWSGEGAEKWNALANNEEWALIIEWLFKYQYTEREVSYSEDWASIFYKHSQGIIDRAIRIFVEAQKQALYSGERTISIQLINKVVKNKFWLEEPAMAAMRSGRKKELQNYQDLYFPEHFENTHLVSESTLLQVYNAVEKLNVPEEFYIEKSQYYFEFHPEYNPERIALEIAVEYNSLNKNKQERSDKKEVKRNSTEKRFSENDLRKCSSENKDELHSKLLEANVLLDLKSEFLKVGT